MTIESNGMSIGVEVTNKTRRVLLTVAGLDDVVVALLDDNHCEALETALRAARLELHARAVGL